jgi:rubrerythrin
MLQACFSRKLLKQLREREGSAMWKTRLLAFACRICPACNAARLWPESGFAKKLAKVEKNCPACNAYKQLYGKNTPST